MKGPGKFRANAVLGFNNVSLGMKNAALDFEIFVRGGHKPHTNEYAQKITINRRKKF